MSYPSQKRRLRPARGVAALVAALLAAGAGLAVSPAQAAQSPTVQPGEIQTMAGTTRNFSQGGYGDVNGLEGGPATQSQFSNPRGLAFGPGPNYEVYVTDALNHRVRKIDNAGNVSLIAGSGAAGNYAQLHDDNIAATSAQLNEPHGVAVDSLGNVFIADSKNCIIRKVDITSGQIARYAGTGEKKDPLNPSSACIKTSGTPDGPALQRALDQPKSLFMFHQGNNDILYVADMGNSQIRTIQVVNNGVAVPADQAQNIRVAGSTRARHYGVGFNNDALDAEFRHPESMWVANDGTIYVSDGGNNLIRAIAPLSGGIRKVSVLAGDEAAAAAHADPNNPANDADLDGNSDGDGGLAINAHLDKPRGITGDNNGNLYIAEEHGSRIRRINLNDKKINTIAGDGSILEQRINGGSLAIKGDPQGRALDAQFALLHDIQVSPDGTLWIADSRNNRVRAMPSAAQAPGAVIPTGGLNPPSGDPGTNPVPTPGKSGYWMLGEDGKVFAFGDSTVMGDAVGRISGKAVHIEPTPNYGGYWINDDRGGVFAFGNAAALGGLPGGTLQAGEKVTSLSSTPSGAGYWLFTSKGRVFTFGDAGKFGDLAAITLNGPIQSSIPTPSGKGYFMVGSDGGVFAFGDAVFRGSMGATKLNQPVMALVPTKTSQGYWLVASDGGIFAFGDAKFRGSMGATKLNKPVVGMVRYGAGYLMVGADGGIFSFSDKPFVGSLGANPPARPIVFAATLDS
jgi:sugar lactone lactonase YvrE